jgi:hypothetical protein
LCLDASGYHLAVPRAIVLTALVLGLLTLTACSPAIQSLVQAPTATPVPQPTAAPTAQAAAKPTTQPTTPPKPTAAPSPVAQATATPAVARATSSPPALVATNVAGLTGAAPSPTVVAESRGAAPPDAVGIASSASSAAAANAADPEAVALCGSGAILSTRAGQVVGRQATVAIARVAASYQPNARGQPTFLNDAPFPNHVFTAVVWGRDRGQFQPALDSYDGKALCVTGPVELFQQRPQIVVSSPSQLRSPR